MDFAVGNHRNVLGFGSCCGRSFFRFWRAEEALRFSSITPDLPRRLRFRSSTRCPETGSLLLTITASTVRPVQLQFEGQASAKTVQSALDAAVPDDLYLDDTHGSPAHRKHLTYYFAEQIRAELQG
jgi:hypothetical protein